MNSKKEIIFINENYDLREFNIFVNGKKLNEERDIYKRKHIFKTQVSSDRIKFLIRQKHPCESIYSMIFESMGYILLDFLYHSGEDRESRAVFEGEIECKCSVINVELLKGKEGSDEKYMFNVFSDNGEVVKLRSEFECPNFLKRRWKIFKWFMYLFPVLVPIVFLLGIILVVI